MPVKRKDQEKRIWEKMAASKTWAAMKRAFLSSAFAGKTGQDDLEFSPDESLKFSKEKIPINKTKDDNKVKLARLCIEIRTKNRLSGGGTFVPRNDDGLHGEDGGRKAHRS